MLAEDAVEIAYGNWVWRECLADHYYMCENCGEYVHERDAYFDRDGLAWCEACAENHLIQCDECGEYVSDDEIIELENGDRICADCARERKNAK